MKILYIAEDGIKFDNEQDCINYEENRKNNIQYLVFAFHFYRNGHWQIANNIVELENMIYSVGSTHMKLERDITEKEYDFLYEEFGYNGPTEEGLYRYTKGEIWAKFEDEFNVFCNKYPMFTFNYKNAD